MQVLGLAFPLSLYTHYIYIYIYTHIHTYIYIYILYKRSNRYCRSLVRSFLQIIQRSAGGTWAISKPSRPGIRNHGCQRSPKQCAAPEHWWGLGMKIQLFTTCFHVKTKATSCQKMDYITSYNIIYYIYMDAHPFVPFGKPTWQFPMEDSYCHLEFGANRSKRPSSGRLSWALPSQSFERCWKQAGPKKGQRDAWKHMHRCIDDPHGLVESYRPYIYIFIFICIPIHIYILKDTRI